MARDPERRALSRKTQNERRKAKRRMKVLEKRLKDAPKGSRLYKEIQKQINRNFELAQMTTRGLSKEDAEEQLRYASNVTTRAELTVLTTGKPGQVRKTAKARGSHVKGMSQADAVAFFATTSSYFKGKALSEGDRMDLIREGINKDFGTNFKNDEEVLDFVRKSDAYRMTLASSTGIDFNSVTTDEFGHYHLEGEPKYQVTYLISDYAPGNQDN